MASLKAKLNSIKKLKAKQLQQRHVEFVSPLDAVKASIRDDIAKSASYCRSVLMRKSIFAGLTEHQLKTIAQSIEKISVPRGTLLVQQDSLGDRCFILESGGLKQTRKLLGDSFLDMDEIPKDSVFGEMCFFTDELRSTNIVVSSETADLYVLMKHTYSNIIDSTKQVVVEIRDQLARDVVSKVKIFQQLTTANRAQVLDAMVPVIFPERAYICRQGKLGKGFFVIVEGTCMVTYTELNDIERNVRVLEAGDYFGEIALMTNSNKNTANVVALETVSCMSLSKADFHVLLAAIEEEMMKQNMMKGVQEEGASALQRKAMKQLTARRRITGVDLHNVRSERRIDSILMRMGKFMSESLWNSMYSRFYRMLLLNSTQREKLAQFGPIVEDMIPFLVANNRATGLKRLQDECTEVLEMDLAIRATRIISRQTAVIHTGEEEVEMRAKLIMGLLQQRNTFRDRLCDKWTPAQHLECAKKVKLMRVTAMNRVYSFGDLANCVYVILRGAVRVFTQQRLTLGTKKYRRVYQEDLFSGEMFGETALEGVSTRNSLVQAITDCDVALISCDDYLMVQNSSSGSSAHHSINLSVDAKYTYLSQMPILKGWEPYRLYRLASATYQSHLAPAQQVLRKGHVNADISFIMSGHMHVVTDSDEYVQGLLVTNGRNSVTHVITTLDPMDYYGESGCLNNLLRLKSPIVECCDAVTASYCDVLVLPAVQFYLLDDSLGTIHQMKTAYAYKRQWRQGRYESILAGRQKQTEKRERRVKERGKNDILGANVGAVAGDFQEDNQTISDINAIGKELGGGDNDLVTLDSLMSTREELRQQHRHARHITHSISLDSLDGSARDRSISMNQSQDLGDNSLMQMSQVTGPGQGSLSGASHAAPSVVHHYHSSTHTVDPFKREKIVGATPVRSLALRTRLADGPKEVRLIHDEREFVMSLSKEEQFKLEEKGKKLNLPPVLKNSYRRRLSEATAHTNGRNYHHVKEMFPSPNLLDQQSTISDL